ncbi:MAG TPA: hemolysin family protein [Anaerolineae bacterium]|nr:hemolysin family protein [Anaerolineae bacterium]
MLTLLLILLIVSLLIFINGLYVAGEFSAVSARKTRIIQAAEEGSRLARSLLPVLTDRHKLDNYIAASQVGITLSSIVLGIYGQQQISPLLEPWIARLPLGDAAEAGTQVAAAGIASTTVLFVLTTLQVVMGELVPKSIAIQYPERTALATALPMKWSADYILKPLIVLLNGSGRLLLRLLRAPEGASHTHLHSPEEILILAEESQRGGLIAADEHRFLQNVFRSGALRAVDVAVPRTRIVASEATRPVRDVLARAADSAYTRIPIYEGDIDQIVGIVHLRDLFMLYRANPDASIRSILRPVPFVPETLTTTAVWERLNEAQSYVAIVFDEYGGTSGLVTREDLVEELFGEMQDEFDQEQALVTQIGAGRLSVRGDLLVSVLNDRLDIDLPHEQSRTVGGLVMDTLGRIPEVGDEIEIDGVQLRVETVDHRSVTRLCVTVEPDKTA